MADDPAVAGRAGQRGRVTDALRQHGPEHLDGPLTESPIIDNHGDGRTQEALDPPRGRA